MLHTDLLLVCSSIKIKHKPCGIKPEHKQVRYSTLTDIHTTENNFHVFAADLTAAEGRK